MPELTVLGGDQTFRVQGSAREGLLIFYDDTGFLLLPPATIRSLLRDFAGRTVSLGAGPPEARPTGSLGAWLRDQLGLVRDMAAHVGAALVAEGLARSNGADALVFPEPQ